jgi:hypothetical protein
LREDRYTDRETEDTMKTFHKFRVRWEERRVHDVEIEVEASELEHYSFNDAEPQDALSEAFKDGAIDLPRDEDPSWPSDDNYWPAAQADIELVSTRREPEPGDYEDSGWYVFYAPGRVEHGKRFRVLKTIFAPENGDGDGDDYPRWKVEFQDRSWAYAWRDEIQDYFQRSETALQVMIDHYFPERMMVFYPEAKTTLAAVEDKNGDMWRVWADGDTEQYTR